MKKALLLTVFCIIGCEADNATRKALYEEELKKNTEYEGLFYRSYWKDS